MIRVFAPLSKDHPSIGEPCCRCKFPIRKGERVCLIPKFETREGNICEADIAHATCALAGLKACGSTIARIKDGDVSPFPVELADGRQATLEECGLSD